MNHITNTNSDSSSEGSESFVIYGLSLDKIYTDEGNKKLHCHVTVSGNAVVMDTSAKCNVIIAAALNIVKNGGKKKQKKTK